MQNCHLTNPVVCCPKWPTLRSLFNALTVDLPCTLSSICCRALPCTGKTHSRLKTARQPRRRLNVETSIGSNSLLTPTLNDELDTSAQAEPSRVGPGPQPLDRTLHSSTGFFFVAFLSLSLSPLCVSASPPLARLASSVSLCYRVVVLPFRPDSPCT